MPEFSEKPSPLSAPKRVSFITLGCAKNEVDTAHMEARLASAGWEVVDWDAWCIGDSSDAEEVLETTDLSDANPAGLPSRGADVRDAAPLDAIVINTCGFLREAIEENLDVIFDLAGLEAVESGHTKLVVAGCMPARFGEDLATELGEADLFLPCAEEVTIVEKLAALCGGESAAPFAPFPSAVVAQNAASSSPVSDASALSTVSEASASLIPPGSAAITTAQTDIARTARTTTSPSAYVKISDGCNRFCSFCAIPYIRGRYHSFTYEQISQEINTLVKQGVREIVLIAQDTGIWGSDFAEPSTLASLLDRLAAQFPTTWLRVLYIQPEHVNLELLQVMAAHENICNYLDIPFQHSDASMLKSMNRKGSREEFLALIALIQQTLGQVALRSTFIVGYPGETEDQFEALCDFVSEIDFDYVGIFAYSPEDGTRAATLPDQVDDSTKQERLRTLRDIADAVSQAQLARFVGQTLDVLVLGVEEDGQLIGRSHYQAPDVDGVTYIDAGEVGEIVPVKIDGTLYYEMEGYRVD